MRSVLVAALSSCADRPLRLKARRFLDGLSCDEMQFIAEFLGSSFLEAAQGEGKLQGDLLECVSEFQCSRRAGRSRSSDDHDHKAIVLLEFLSRSGLRKAPAPMRPAHA